jgi:hypothetical protein
MKPSSRQRCVALGLVAGALLLPAVAQAAPGKHGSSSGLRPLWAGLAPEDVVIDGMPREWAGDWRLLDQPISGSRTGELQARVLLATSKDSLFLAADIQGDAQIGDGDRIELLVGFPGGSSRTILLYPGVPGKSRAKATIGGGLVRGAKVVEAPVSNGYTLEAQIPWSALPESKTLQIGLRGAVFVHDAERSQGETVVGSAPTRDWESLPAISTQPELELSHGLLLDKGMWQPPAYNLLGNLHGDPLKERVLVYGRYLAVLGPHYRGGSEYYYRDLGVDADQGELPSCELQDLSGDGRSDIVLRKRVRQGDSSIDVIEVLTFQSSEAPETAFAQEVAVKTPQGSFENAVRLGARRIVIEAGKSNGSAAHAFRMPFRTDADPPLLPWGAVASQSYALSGNKFVKSDESKRSGASGEEPPAPTPQVGPSSPSAGAGAGGDAVLAQYRKEHGASGAPRFKLSANLLGDAKPEHVVLQDRDLVVYGPGFRDGLGYAVVTLPFASPDDVSSVKTRDLTGKGPSEILVEGVMRAQAPAEAGGGEVARKVLLVYQLTDASLRRVFGAELERSMGPNKVSGNVDFAAGEIVLRPGRAAGFTEKTYPFPQEVAASGGIEPLLLPWSGAKPVHYRWDGSRFAPQ